jgi:transposase
LKSALLDYSLDTKQKEMAVAMFNGGAPKIDIAKHFGVTRQTIYALLKGYEV